MPSGRMAPLEHLTPNEYVEIRQGKAIAEAT
jgi:hypothetical protein